MPKSLPGGAVELPVREGKPPVKVKRISDPDNPESSLVLCRSALRREKEAAMLSGAETRFLKDVEALLERMKKRQTQEFLSICAILESRFRRVNTLR